jgi:hypothetical protein
MIVPDIFYDLSDLGAHIQYTGVGRYYCRSSPLSSLVAKRATDITRRRWEIGKEKCQYGVRRSKETPTNNLNSH